jgi:glycosyltransferase involved in cell wall biosynthesis
MAKVSVIVPVYNGAEDVGRCLESVMNQTLSDLEIVCVNDGSKDNTLEILNEFAARDARIKVVDRENGGLSVARNTGMKHATGDYVHFLDHDDTMKEDAYEKLSAISDRDALDALFFSSSNLFESKEDLAKYGKDTALKAKNAELSGEVVGPEQYLDVIVPGKFQERNAQFCLYRRSFVEENDLRFYPGIYFEDHLYHFLTLMKAKRISSTGEAYHQRYIREGSIMHQPNNYKHALGFISTLAQAAKYILAEELPFPITNNLILYVNTIVRHVHSRYRLLDGADLKLLQEHITDEEEFVLRLMVNPAYDEWKRMQKSPSYRAGRVVTFLPRKLKDLLKWIKVITGRH